MDFVVTSCIPIFIQKIGSSGGEISENRKYFNFDRFSKKLDL